MKRTLYILQAKTDDRDYEAYRDDQDQQTERAGRKILTLQADLEKKQAEAKSHKDKAKQKAASLTKRSSSSQEIVSMFMEEYEKLVAKWAEEVVETKKVQGTLVDESGVFDMQKKHNRYLEQYRTDSIFRIMGLKAHVKVLQENTDSQQGINKLASSIGV